MITNFEELVNAAHEQDQPQRLLFLFAKAENQRKPKKSKHRQSGTITPVMCVDKLPEEIESFKALVAEADRVSKDWNFMIVAGLSGQNGRAPTSDETEPFLNQMVDGVASGMDLSRYVIFDRDEEPVVIEPK